MEEIAEIASSIEEYSRNLKDMKKRLKELVEDTQMYKTIYASSLTAPSDGVVVSEKDAAKHAFNVTLKNIRGT